MDVKQLLAYLRVPRTDIMEKALGICVGLSGQEAFQIGWAKTEGAIEHMVQLACARTLPQVSIKASTCLVNMSGNPTVRNKLLDNKLVQLCIGKLRDAESAKEHGLYVSLLANLTADRRACMELLALDDGKGLDYFATRYFASGSGSETELKVFEHGGYVIHNLSQHDIGRKWLLGSSLEAKKRYLCQSLPRFVRMNVRDAPITGKPTGKFVYDGHVIEAIEEKNGWIRHKDGWSAREWDGTTVFTPYGNNFTMLVSLADSRDAIRRRSTYQTIRNCALDTDVLPKIMCRDLVQVLSIPLVVATPYDDDDSKGMPAKVLAKNRLLAAAEAKRGSKLIMAGPTPAETPGNLEDAAVIKAVLECFYRMARDEKTRRVMDKLRVYVLLREFDNLETVKEVKELIESIVSFFILDKECLNQATTAKPGDAPPKIQNEIWTSPTGPEWKMEKTT